MHNYSEFGGQSEETEMLFASIKKVMPISIAIILVLLALTFRSPSQGMLIVLLIPVGFFCAVLGHGIETLIANTIRDTVPKPVSNLSYYGVIALAGIIVNDAVVFLEKFNMFVRSGMPVYNAAFNAG